ncbi:MAG TPA: serine/threonine protein kinase [Desulfobacteraceae bacterium]|nr:serine/threonine protein kinase [Desulfobacteraceae bacterium]
MAEVPKIPGYVIEKELGQGGMARVFLAKEAKLERYVALKVMALSPTQDDSVAKRFVREARTAAGLNHVGIVPIYDVGEQEGFFYLAMEFLPGGSLAGIIEQGPVLPEKALEIFVSIALALDYAHGEGFIHRDVKPDNILFRKDGTPVLCDFGIARAVGSATRLTKTGMSVGTPHYMSPEQARGKKLDGRSDLYSLGVVLYELLTGKVPFEAEDSVAVAIAHVQDPVPPLQENLVKYQPLLDKLLAKDPEERFQSGAEALSMVTSLGVKFPKISVANENTNGTGNKDNGSEMDYWSPDNIKIEAEPVYGKLICRCLEDDVQLFIDGEPVKKLCSGFRFTIRLKEGWHVISATRRRDRWDQRILIEEEQPVHTTIAFPNKDKLTTGRNSIKKNEVQVDNRIVMSKSPIFIVPAVFLILIGLIFPFSSVFPDLTINLLITMGCLVLGLGYSQQKRLAIVVTMVACFFILYALGTKFIFLGWIRMGVVIASGLAITIGLLMERYRVLLVLLYLLSFILMVQIVDTALWYFMFTFIGVLVQLLLIMAVVKSSKNFLYNKANKFLIYHFAINLILVIIALAEFYTSGLFKIYFHSGVLIDGVISQIICAVVSSVLCVSILAVNELRKV